MEFLGVGCLGCCVFVALPLLVLVLYFGWARPSLLHTVEEAAATWGFEKGPKHATVHWWVGHYQGRPAGVVPVALKMNWASDGGRARRGVRLVVVPDRPALGVVAYRAKDRYDPMRVGDSPFEETFHVSDLERLPEPVRDAMQAYARVHSGPLRVRDRGDAPSDLLPEGLFEQANVLVVAEFLVGGATMDNLQERIDAMTDIAEALEQHP